MRDATLNVGFLLLLDMQIFASNKLHKTIERAKQCCLGPCPPAASDLTLKVWSKVCSSLVNCHQVTVLHNKSSENAAGGGDGHSCGLSQHNKTANPKLVPKFLLKFLLKALTKSCY